MEPWQLSSEHIGFGNTGHRCALARWVAMTVEAVVSLFSCVAPVMAAKAINLRKIEGWLSMINELMFNVER